MLGDSVKHIGGVCHDLPNFQKLFFVPDNIFVIRRDHVKERPHRCQQHGVNADGFPTDQLPEEVFLHDFHVVLAPACRGERDAGPDGRGSVRTDLHEGLAKGGGHQRDLLLFRNWYV